MKNFTKLTTFALLCTTASWSNASSLEIDINGDAIKAKYNLNSEMASMGLAVAALVTDDNGEAFSFDVRSQGKLKQSPDASIRGGFGVRAYHISPDGGDSFQALALGGYADLAFPSLQDVSFGIDLYYAPSITMTDDLDNLHELTLRVNYQLFENAKIFAGARDLEVSVGDYDFDIDDNIHFGFKLDF